MGEILDIRNLAGLTSDEAQRRLTRDGPNELPTTRRRGVFAILLEIIHEPMFLLLVGGGVVYLLMGPEHVRDALMLLGFVVVVMGITLYQQRRTERALEALRDLSSPRALVIRDGRQQRIAGRDVVRGDLVMLGEGDRVPADGAMLTAINLTLDESLLTGESVSVRKTAAAMGSVTQMDRPGGEDTPFVYAGSLVVRGQGVAEVLSTGMATEIGRIGKALATLEPERTLLQKETGRLVAILAGVGLSLCAVAVVVYGLTRGNTVEAWQNGLLAGITMAMAILPEEFPVVLTIFLALGAWRLSRFQVLTRRVPAVETLGAATVLCVDKTGTLTANRMSIRMLDTGAASLDTEKDKTLPEAFHHLVEFGVLASKRDPFDPMDKAFKELGQRSLARTEHLHENWTLIHEYPLSPELLALSHVWQSPDGSDYVIAAKGAPEAIADLCHLSEVEVADVERRVGAMAEQGLRVLGVARGTLRKADGLPGAQHDVHFVLLGLVGLADPVRPGVPRAVRECRSAGVRVVMITGDYPVTARHIADQIGLTDGGVITGSELAAMSESDLRGRIGATSVFARVVPEQKLRIVEALKANGEIVAMTGDGVNDAPALKSAHIGIAMGGRGSDVAREAASLVLLDDNFTSIVAGIRMGRRIFDNIRKAVSYIFAIHVPIAALSLLPLLFGGTVILWPVHVVFLELIIDPACSVIFEMERAEPDIMRRPPRKPTDRLFSLHAIQWGLLQGVSVLAIVLAVYFVAAWAAGFRGYDDQTKENEVRALTFTTLVVANLALILTNRSWRRTILRMFRVPNPALWWVVGGAMTVMAAVLYVPGLRNLFRFGVLHPLDLLICLGAGIVGVLWFEVLKTLRPWQRADTRRQGLGG